MLKLLAFLDQKLVTQQKGRISLDLLEPLFHQDYGYTASGYGFIIRCSGGRGVLVCLSQPCAHLVKPVDGLTGNCLFLGEFFWSACRTGGLFRCYSGVFLLLFIDPGLVIILRTGAFIRFIYGQIITFFFFLLV